MSEQHQSSKLASQNVEKMILEKKKTIFRNSTNHPKWATCFSDKYINVEKYYKISSITSKFSFQGAKQIAHFLVSMLAQFQQIYSESFEQE